jgi:hypothetical protein
MLLVSFSSLAQFNQVNSNTPSTSITDSIWRFGSVAISHAFRSPFINKLMVTDKYNSVNNRTAYFGLNDPRFDLSSPDSTSVGLATLPNESHNTLVANHYANFKAGMNFSDVHTSTTEFGFFRGMSETLGYRDGGHLAKAAVVKIAANFGNNNRAYTTNDFDLINLRFFTGDVSNPLPVISNFYALRMEDFRGINASMIQNAWGVYMKPSFLKNYFGGNVGIGTSSVSHPLTVSATSDPIKISGIQTLKSDSELLSIDASGIVHKQPISSLNNRFKISLSNENLDDNFDIYIHKGGAAIFNVPPPSMRTGKAWRIVNIGTGEITLSDFFYEGNAQRKSILSVPGANSYLIFSDGTSYISL